MKILLFILCFLYSINFAFAANCISASSTTVVNPSCSNNDGSITVGGVSGGSVSPYVYQYSLDGTTWQLNATFIGLAAGNYTVQIRDKNAHSCTGSISAILLNIALSATVIPTAVTPCKGGNNGILTVTAQGGTGVYQYSKNGVNWLNNNGVFSGLIAGDYIIQVRDRNNQSCTFTCSTATIVEPDALTATVTKNDISCNGLSDGTITISNPAGGTGPYLYSIDGTNYVLANQFIGLSAGPYKIYVQDISCANQVATRTIVDPAVLSGSASVTAHVTGCFGGSNGSITVNADGGSGLYQYSKTGNAGSWVSNGGIFNNLSAGDYNIQIRDKNNILCPTFTCTKITVDQPAALIATVTKSDITCNGLTDGTITITNPAGGTGPYMYSIDGTNYVSSALFTGLAAGSYKIYVQDISCSNQVATRTILEPEILSAQVDFSNVTCFGASDGTITISSPTGGSEAYQYTINGGSASTTWQNDGNYINRPFSTNDVRIRDKVHTGCSVVLNGNLEITRPPKLNATVASTNLTCNGANDGKITISSPSGGPSSLLPTGGKYYYSINGDHNYIDNGGIFTNLPPSSATVSYDVWIQDATDILCTVQLGPQTITEPALLSATVSSTEVTCFGAVDGTITISAPSGGSGTYQYSKDGGTHWLNNGGLFSNLAFGTYNVQICDKAHPGCYTILNSTLVITRPPKLNAKVASTNVTCNGANDGKITISSPSGGPSSLLPAGGKYYYSIDGDHNYIDNGGIFTNLPPSSASVSYDVWIQDATNLNCTVELGPQTITQPDAFSFYVDSDSDGYGTGSLVIICSKDANTPPPGYSLNNTDCNDDDASVWISSDAPTGNTSQSFCAISNPTVADISITGNNPIWYDASSAGNVVLGTAVLIDGKTYYASQTVSNGCESTDRLAVSVSIGNQSAPTGDASQSFCSSDSPKVSDIVVNGTSIIWYTAATGGSVVDRTAPLVNGTTYYASQTVGGCESADRRAVTVTLTTQAPPTIGTITHPTCSTPTGSVGLSGLPSGAWTITPSSGSPVNGNGSTYTFGSLTASTNYTFTVTNASGCTSVASGSAAVHAQPATPVISTGTLTDPAKCGENGSIVLHFTNVPDGSYSITYTSGSFTGISVTEGLAVVAAKAGAYNDLQITAHGCTSATGVNASLTDPAAPSPPHVGTVIQPTCSTATGTVDLSGLPASGSWIVTESIGSTTINGSGTTGLYSSLAPGTYTFTVTNSAGCISGPSGNAVINDAPAKPAAPGGTSSQSFCLSSSPLVSDIAVGGTSIIWYTASTGGSVVTETTPLVNGTTYYASQTIGGCESTDRRAVTVTLTTQTPPTIGTITHPTCSTPTGSVILSGLPSGAWTITPSSGSPVNGNGSTFTFSSLTASTSYTFTVTNASGCTSVVSGNAAIHAQPATPTISTGTLTDPATCGGKGFILLNFTNVPDNTYSISYVSGTFSGVVVSSGTATLSAVAGTYADLQISVAGCTSATGISATLKDLNAPAAPTAGITQPTCALFTGTITVTQPAPGAGISYTLTGITPAVASQTNSTGVFPGLNPGDYNLTTTNSFNCTSGPTSFKVNALPALPALFTVTGGTGVAVGLTGSQVGVNYQLVNGTTNTGSPLPGTGLALSFGIQSADGTYIIVATNTTTSCTRTMTGSAIVTSGSAVFTVTGGGSFCAGGSGVAVGLSGSKKGTLYQLKLNGHSVGNVIFGTGSAISFGLKTLPGTYTIAAVTILPLTSVPMTGSAIIILNPLPPAPGVITGITAICTGNTSTLYETTTGGVWSSSNTGIATVSVSGVVTGILRGTATIRYTITNGNGCSNSASTAVTVSSGVSQPANFNLSASTVRQGQRNVIYAVPAVAGDVYAWSYSGLGATISGTTNLVFVSFSNNATSGLLSVYASNGCGSSIPRTLNITVVKNRLKMDSISAISQSGIPGNSVLSSELRVFPNPAQGLATFEFRIGENAHAKLDIYSLSGQRIMQIYNANVQAGVIQSVLFDQILPAGLYLCVLSWNGKIITVKLAVTK